MEMSSSPYMAPPTPSPNPNSNLEVHELEDWLTNQFKCSNVAGESVECVPVSTLLNSSFPLNHSSSASAQQSVAVACTEDKLFELFRLKFLDVVGYHFDGHSVGGSLNFLPHKLLVQAFIEAQQQSATLLKKLCVDNKLDGPTVTRLGDKLKKFVGDARVKIAAKNTNNCKRYLERNKKNLTLNFGDTLKEQYVLLYQEPVPLLPLALQAKYYMSATMADNLKALSSKVVLKWTNIKNIAAMPGLGAQGSQGSVSPILPFDYNDDLEKSLNNFINEILTANKKRNEQFLHCQLEATFDLCKKNIETTVNTTKYLDEIQHEDINIHVTNYQQQFLTQIKTKTIMEDVYGSNQEQFKSKLQGKGNELLNYGENLLKIEIEKGREAMHSECVTQFKNFIQGQQGKHRLKRVPEIYEQYILGAFEHVKRHCDSNVNEANNSDEENTEIATSSQGTTREPLSTSISPRSNIASEQNRDMNNDHPNDDSNANVDGDGDSEEDEISPPQSKRHKKHRNSREKKGKSRRSSK